MNAFLMKNCNHSDLFSKILIFIAYQMSKSQTKIRKASQGNSIKGSKTSKAKQRSPQYVNVNSYKHFLAVPTTNEDYIQWAFGLRQYKAVKSNKALSTQVPNTYYKNTESNKQKHIPTQLNTNINFSQFQHLDRHNMGTQPSSGLLRFQTSLRTQNISQLLVNRQRKWRTYAKKDRHQIPKVINAKSMKKRFINQEDLQSALDGNQNYPKYSQKIIQPRNYGQFRHMLKGQINLPSIGWQTNLRRY